MGAERDGGYGSVGPTWSAPGQLASRAEPPDDEPRARSTHPFEVDEAGRYTDGHLLGCGGMGRVTGVMDQRRRREVALKVAVGDAGDAAATPGLASRLGQEASLRTGPTLPAGPAQPRAVRFLAGASDVVVSDTSGTIRRVALDAGLVQCYTATPLGSIAQLDVAGGWLIAAGDRGGALVLNVETGATLMRLRGEPVSLRADASGVNVVTSDALFHVVLPAKMMPPVGPAGPGLATASPSPDGRYVAAARSSRREDSAGRSRS